MAKRTAKRIKKRSKNSDGVFIIVLLLLALGGASGNITLPSFFTPSHDIDDDLFLPNQDRYNGTTDCADVAGYYDNSSYPHFKSLVSCNSYDYIHPYTARTASWGDCWSNIGIADTDSDGDYGFTFDSNYFNTYLGHSTDLSPQGVPIDESCIVLQDWDQDGTCDHRVASRYANQADTDYSPDAYYYTITNGYYTEHLGSVCSGWSP